MYQVGTNKGSVCAFVCVFVCVCVCVCVSVCVSVCVYHTLRVTRDRISEDE